MKYLIESNCAIFQKSSVQHYKYLMRYKWSVRAVQQAVWVVWAVREVRAVQEVSGRSECFWRKEIESFIFLHLLPSPPEVHSCANLDPALQLRWSFCERQLGTRLGVRARWFLKFLENQINFLVLIFGKNAQKWYFGCPNVNKKKPFFHQKLPKHVGKTIHNAISFVWLSFLQRFRANFEIRLFYWV